jgi:hypothetical protein
MPCGSAETVSVLPEVVEAIGGELSVEGGVLDILVSEVVLDGAGVLAVVGKFEAGRMAHHVRMDLASPARPRRRRGFRFRATPAGGQLDNRRGNSARAGAIGTGRDKPVAGSQLGRRLERWSNLVHGFRAPCTLV